MATIDLTEQLLAQGIALPGLNFHIVDEADGNSRDANDESSNLGSDCASPSQAQNESNFEFGKSLEGDLIEVIKDYRCIWDVSCRSFKETLKKQQAWKQIAMKLKQDGKPITAYSTFYCYQMFLDSFQNLCNTMHFESFFTFNT